MLGHHPSNNIRLRRFTQARALPRAATEARACTPMQAPLSQQALRRALAPRERRHRGRRLCIALSPGQG